MFIFVCSPGRSGTKYISELFKYITNIPSFHGGEPNLRYIIDSGAYRYNNPLVVLERVNKIKELKNKYGYFDSSQIFIHRLVINIINDKILKPLYVINLIRNPLEVAISYENRNSTPSFKNDLWRLPLISSDRIIKIDKKLTLFQENLFDWIDTQMKFEKYKDKFDKFYIFKFENLNNKEEIQKLFNFFEINFDEIKHLQLNNKFKKNENKIKSIITVRHIKETVGLINYLKTLDNYPKNIIDIYISPLIA